jgi:hypothetical protein
MTSLLCFSAMPNEICPLTNTLHTKTVTRDVSKPFRFIDFEPLLCDCGYDFVGYTFTCLP